MKKPKRAGDRETAPEATTNAKSDGLVGWIKSIAIALVLWIFLRALLLEAFHITSGSMERTLLVGDLLFVNKAVYGAQLPFIGTRIPAFRDPRRNEIVIFDSVDTPGLTVVKRVVGVPGDTIAMRSNVLSINGQPQNEPYVVGAPNSPDPEDPRFRTWQVHRVIGRDPADYSPTLKNWGPFVVPADSFFMMGDNRDDSYDSRYWGFLGRDRIRGRATIIYFSYNKNGVLPLPAITAIRWRRLLKLIR